jgi:hypothetical protein
MTSQCYFEDNKIINNYALKVDASGGFTAQPVCATLYKGGFNNKGLCHHVEDDRMKLYSSDTQIAYGVGPIDDTMNMYPDCNCENSLLRGEAQNVSIMDKKTGKQVYNINDDMLAQFFDKRCFNVGLHAYKPYNAVPQNLCINLDQTNNISADSKSTVNKTQQCNLSTTQNNTQTEDPQPTSPYREPPNPNFKPRTSPTTTVSKSASGTQISKTTFIATVSSISVSLLGH